MVRGLIIRQTFLVADLVLFGLILYAAGLVVVQLFQSPTVVVPTAEVGSGGLGEGESLLIAVRDRGDYNGIALFGPAGRFDPKLEPAPVAVVEEADDGVPEETKLNLRLWGATSLSPTSIYASASIEDASTRDGSRLYFIGDTIVPDVTLEEVYPRWVIIKNGREIPPVRERLSMDDEPEDGSGADQGSSRPTPRAVASRVKRVDLDKQAFVKELYVNYADLVTKIKPTLYRDASGAVAGITAADISDVPLAKTLGLENGDVLQTVNNEKIDSQEKILEMVQKYANTNTFRIGILRNGQVENINYNLN